MAREPVATSRRPHRVLAADRPIPRHQLAFPRASPAGGWLAFAPRESGRWEVCVEPFRRPGSRVCVSPEGGSQPQWRGDGKELFHVAPDGKPDAVAVDAPAEGLGVGLPDLLFRGVPRDPVVDSQAVTRDGQRFLVVVPLDEDHGSGSR